MIIEHNTIIMPAILLTISKRLLYSAIEHYGVPHSNYIVSSYYYLTVRSVI